MSFSNLDVLLDDVTKALAGPPVYNYRRHSRIPEYTQNKTEDGYKIEVPAIGVSKDGVSVKVQDQMLLVKVTPTVNSNYSREFNCEWLVPDTVDKESVHAKLENGLLTVSLKFKKPDVKKVNVDVMIN